MDLCLDIGGTSITAACMENGAPVFPPKSFPARADLPRGALLDHFLQIFSETLREADTAPAGIRMAFPGPFDYINGIPHIMGLGKFESIFGIPLREALRARMTPAASPLADVPMHFLNDVTAFALGEAHRHGLQKARGLYLCIGTGCGSAFLVNGAAVGSECPGVPENGWVYPLPFRGQTLDDTLSKRGLMALSCEICGEPLEGYALSRRCRAGDENALLCYRLFGERVLEALSPVLAAFQPEALVLGGQVMKSASYFLAPLQAFAKKNDIRLFVCTDTAQSALIGLTI